MTSIFKQGQPTFAFFCY